MRSTFNFIRLFALVTVSALLTLSGCTCGEGVSADDAGSVTMDAGAPRDAGSQLDAGASPSDAGATSDASVDGDAGLDADASVDADAGIDSDAGLDADASVEVDAGIDSDGGLDVDAGDAFDAGVAVDAGSPPAIVTQPAPVELCSGATAHFEVSASGDALDYQWYQGTTGDTSHPVGGAIDAGITFVASASGPYWVRVLNAVGSVSSDTASLTVFALPAVTAQPAAHSEGCLGTTVDLTFSVDAADAGLQWFLGATGDTASAIAGATRSTLTHLIDGGALLWARATTGCGVADSTQAIVVANAPPFVVTQPVTARFCRGLSMSLSAGVESPDASVQWFTGAAGDTSSPVADASSPSLSVAPTVDTSYWAQFANGCGTSNTNAALVQPAETQITVQPQSHEACFRRNTELSVTATGVGAVTYQWYRNLNEAIDGGTSATLTVTPADFRVPLWVAVTSECGPVGSDTVVIDGGWRVAFDINLGATAGTGNYGAIDVDGGFWFTKWATNDFGMRFNDGGLDTPFTISGVSGVRNLTHVTGSIIAAANTSTTVTLIDELTRTSTGTVTMPMSTRSVTYTPTAEAGDGGYYISNFGTDIVLVSSTGATISTIPQTTHGMVAMYGTVFDGTDPAHPSLWVLDGTAGTRFVELSLPSGTPTGSARTITTDLPGVSGGGAFIINGPEPILVALPQASVSHLIGYSLCH